VTATLRGRIVVSFVAFALVVAAIFGLAGAAVLYSAEDRFFETLLAEEAAALASRARVTGAWAAPRHDWMTVHVTRATMPPDLAPQLAAAPRRVEFTGAQGRHYHVRALPAPGGGAPAAWLVAEVSERLVIRPLRRTIAIRWAIMEAAIVALAIGLALAIGRRVARPLSQLAASVRALDPALPAHAAVLRTGDREVRLVATALDELRTRVAAFVEREQAFTRDASHELRTPLSVIRSSTARALEDDTLADGTRRTLERVLRSAEQLEVTIRSLLALAREGELAAPDTPTALRPVIEEAVLEQGGALDAAALTVELDVPRGATLPASAAVLRIVLANVLGNACVHAAPGVVHVRVAGDGALVIENAVSPGTMPDVDTLAEPGVRREHSPGYGLGLAIATRLCARSGLSLDIRTDRRTTFAVRIAAARRDVRTSHAGTSDLLTRTR
jgi:signal transduction histidine kinase